MPSRLFKKLLNDIPAANPYFEQKPDAAKRLGASPLQKLTAAVRRLAYGVSSDILDEYRRLSETSVAKSTIELCKTICDIYGSDYLRLTNNEELISILKINERRGFPGILGKISLNLIQKDRLITCTGFGRIAQKCGQGDSMGKIKAIQ